MGELSFWARSNFCCVMMRALRSEQAEQEGTDFVTIFNSCQKKFYPESDLHDWNARYNTIKRLADDLVKEFRKKAPVQANQTLLRRLQSLESENARLKSETSQSRRQEPKSRRVSGPSKPGSAPPPEPIVPAFVEDHEEEDDTAAFGSPSPGLEDPDGPLDRDSQPLAAEDTYNQYLPTADSVRYLESCSLQATSIRNVNSWLASTALGKGKNRAIDAAVDEFVAACSKLDDGKKKPVDRIAVDWGLSVALAAKLSEKCLIRLIAGAHLLATK